MNASWKSTKRLHISVVIFQILVHGSVDATEFLADYCRVTPGLVSGSVYTPAFNDIVDVTTEGFIYQVGMD